MISDADLIKTVEEIGESIKANAVKIAGNYKYQTTLKIIATVDMDGFARIKVLHEYVPKTTIAEKRTF